MIFKTEELISFYNKIKELGITKTFKNFNNERCFLIRHDVDWDLNAALRMARLENSMNIKSTFFVLVNTNNYNLFSFENQNIIQEIEGYGHEIGLHFDASFYNKDFNTHAKKEALILNSILKNKVVSIALHNPSILNYRPKFKEYNDAYSQKYFIPEYYLSDSCFGFRGKDPFKFIENLKNSPFQQILLHPLHFSENGNKTYIDKFEEMFTKKILRFDVEQKRNPTYNLERKERGFNIKID
jgi:peptidoglycan/xylan/chitin deacetylase (PgdA/CDA1 family)